MGSREEVAGTSKVFIYLVIPKFYNYDKSKIAKIICKNQNVECLIKGKIYYSFYPTPRIKIKDLIISSIFEKKDTLVSVKNAAIKLSLKNLLVKEKHEFKKIKFNNYTINLNTKNFKKYKNIFSKKNNLIPITFSKGEIIFSDEKNYVATIGNANLFLKFKQNSIQTKLKGK